MLQQQVQSIHASTDDQLISEENKMVSSIGDIQLEQSDKDRYDQNVGVFCVVFGSFSLLL